MWILRSGAQPPVERIGAYGRVSPGERAVTVAVPYYLGSPQVVAELHVHEGDRVTRDQQLALTQSRTLAASEVAIAKAHLATAQERTLALTAGPKSQEVDAQEALIKSLEADARAEKAKKRPDSTTGKAEAAARAEALDWKVTMSQRQLEAMREVRPAEVAVSRAETAEATVAVARAEALLAVTEIKAPIDGQVLKILTYPGEGAAGQGLLELGDTGAMVIKAELSVADAARAKLGARATIKSEAWQGELEGTVTRIDARVERSILSAPSTFSNVDRHIIEATVVPVAAEQLAGRAGAEVTVLISADSTAK
jgi:HlyD family secretion protein